MGFSGSIRLSSRMSELPLADGSESGNQALAQLRFAPLDSSFR